MSGAMNDEQAKKVGLRALAAGFEWKPRCLDGHWGRQVVRSRDDESGDPVLTLEWDEHDNPRLACLSDRAWPDFRDETGATLGALLAQVREAAKDAGVSVWHDQGTGTWSWMAGGCHHGVWIPSDADGYSTEAEALVSALEWAKGGKAA